MVTTKKRAGRKKKKYPKRLPTSASDANPPTSRRNDFNAAIPDFDPFAEKQNEPIYSIALADEVCRRISLGESLKQVCRDEKMPGKSTVHTWKREDRDGFAEKYWKAKLDRLEHWEDENIEIADDSRNDWIEREVRAGRIVTVLNDEHVRRSQLRIETRKWLMSKLGGAKYGNLDRIEHSGPGGSAINVRSADELTDAQLAVIALAGRPASAEPEESEE